jgi:hypothetical protein
MRRLVSPGMFRPQAIGVLRIRSVVLQRPQAFGDTSRKAHEAELDLNFAGFCFFGRLAWECKGEAEVGRYTCIEVGVHKPMELRATVEEMA